MGWGCAVLVQTMSSSPVRSCPNTVRSVGSTSMPDTSVPALQRLPQPTLYTLAGTIPLLGAAQRLLRRADRRKPTMPLSPVAMARTDVELSVRQIHRNVADQMECVRAGGYPDAELMLRTRRDQVMASDRAARAIGAIVQILAMASTRHWWNGCGATCRPPGCTSSSNVEQVLSVAGRFALGLDVDDLIW